MNTFLNFGTQFVISLLIFGLLAKWYVWPFLCRRPYSEGLLLLLLPFLLRYLGLVSLVPGVVDPESRNQPSLFIRPMAILPLLSWRFLHLFSCGRGIPERLRPCGSSMCLGPSILSIP